MNALSRALVLTLLASGSVSGLARGREQAGGQEGQSFQDRLLQDVLDSNGRLRCKGVRHITFRMVRDGKPETRTVYENVVRDGPRSRTEYSGSDEIAGQIAVDDGKFRWHYLPKENVINKSPSLQHQNSERLDMLMRERRAEYKVTVSDGGSVAGYPTFLITLTSDRGTEHKIWVEKSRKAILKREINGPDKNRGMSYYFESFEYRRHIEGENFVINKPGATVLEPKDRLALAAKKVTYSPYAIVGDASFELYESSSFVVDGKSVLRSTYGDGRTVVTLVQVKGPIDEQRLKGREGARINVHVWQADGYNFALVGDLPVPELERLAKLVRR